MDAKTLAGKWKRGMKRAEVIKICNQQGISYNSVRDEKNAEIFARNSSREYVQEYKS